MTDKTQKDIRDNEGRLDLNKLQENSFFKAVNVGLTDLPNKAKINAEFFEQLENLISRCVEHLNEIVNSFTYEEELLSLSKQYIDGELSSLANLTNIAKELNKNVSELEYRDIVEYLSHSWTIKALRDACKKREWSILNLSRAISEEIEKFYPSENNTTSEQLSFDLDNLEIVLEDEKTIKEELIAYNSSNLASSNYVFAIDPISRQLLTLIASTEEEQVINEIDTASYKDHKKGLAINTCVTLNFNELYNELGITGINNFDTAVIGAIISEWERGIREQKTRIKTTPQTLYRIMTKNLNSRITEAMEEAIIQSLRKLRTCNIGIDATEEIKKYYPGLKLNAEGILINTVVYTGIYNNKKSTVIEILSLNRSPLYNYAKEKKQLCSVPFKYLSANKINKTEEVIIIENYLISRIETRAKTSNTILFNTLFEETNLEECKVNKKKRKTVIDKIKELLEGYVETGYIKSYRVNKQGRAQHSITFIK